MYIRKKEYYIKSCGQNIYIQFWYPKRILPAPAIIVGHGLRSYYPGFLDMFMRAYAEAGYIAVKFHFVGTGKSDGKFEQKSTTTMLQNFEDVIDFVASHGDVNGIGIMGRSNAGSLILLHGPDPRIKAYVLLGSPIFYSANMGKFINTAKIQGEYFVHKSFKRAHTKGPGRLPLSYVDELEKYDAQLLANIKKIRHVMLLQSKKDEAVPIAEGHYDYVRKNLPKPRKTVLIDATNHSMGGKKRQVVALTIPWFKKYLPLK